MTKTANPHVTDEQIDIISNSPFPRVSDALKHLREIYEADRARLLAEIAALRETAQVTAAGTTLTTS